MPKKITKSKRVAASPLPPPSSPNATSANLAQAQARQLLRAELRAFCNGGPGALGRLYAVLPTLFRHFKLSDPKAQRALLVEAGLQPHWPRPDDLRFVLPHPHGDAASS
jgi:hypothetical protein